MADNNDQHEDPLAAARDEVADRLRGGGNVPHEAAQAPVSPRTETPCPVVPVGMRGGSFIFLTPSGQLTVLSGAKLVNKGELGSLFETRVDWLWDNFPVYKGQGEDKPPRHVGWNAGYAGEWLRVQAAARGLVDPERMLRGPGVWPGAAGGLIVHAGDRVWVGPSPYIDSDQATELLWCKAGLEHDRYIYPAWPPVPAPAFEAPATASDIGALYQTAMKWEWKPDVKLGARLWLGWHGCAILTGALRWRPHLRVCAEAGQGKTELENLSEGILGGEAALERTSDPTAAFLRQVLGPRAGAVVIDEVEPNPNSPKPQELMDTLRLASSDKQGPVGRGGADGRPVRQYVRACIYLSSILAVPTLPQNRQRLTHLELGDLPPNADYQGVLKDVEKFMKMGAGIRARMILGWPRFRENLIRFAAALARNKQTRRVSDQLGHILAGAETLLSDAVVSEKKADELAKLACLLAADEPVERDYDECLAYMLSTKADPYRHGDRQTLGRLIVVSQEEAGDGPNARKVLKDMGLKVHPMNHTWQWLLVANTHRALDEVFRDSRWAGGTWAQAMRRVKGSLHRDGEIRDEMGLSAVAKFGDPKSRRFVALPRALFDMAGEETEDAA